MERAKEMDSLISALSERPFDILIVEDSDSNLALIELYFAQTACRLDFALNGEEAVAKFRDKDYALILMDIQMPVMDGYEATRAIRKIEMERGATPVPIVAVTANAFSEDKESCMEAGCTGYLTKPVSKATLLWCVAEHTRSTQ